MSEHQMETRRRSRSKTPFLRSACDHENCEHAGEEGHTHHHNPKKKAAIAPNVQTIIEEAPSNQTQYRSTTTTITATSSQRGKTASPEDKIKLADIATKQIASSSSTSSTTVTKSRKVVGGLASSTPKASHMVQSFAEQFSTTGSGGERRLKEVTQNELNTQFERSQKLSASNPNNSQQSNVSAWRNNISSTIRNGDLNDHVAYREYKLAGEYWNKTPKTDYTYSELSPHRRELAPGIVAMPNMSRRSLENHNDRVYHMIERNPAQEEFIRKRYSTQQQKYIDNRLATERLLFDSGDEMDYSTGIESYAKKQNYNLYAKHDEQWWLMRFLTTIITSITSVWTSATGAFVDENTKFYQTEYYGQQRGFFGTIGHGFASFGQYLYSIISSILCWDTRILQSSNPDGRGRKRFFILLLLLLPLLLLGAWCLLNDIERQYYLQRTEDIFPLSILASLKGTVLGISAMLQGLVYQVPLMVKNFAKEKLIRTESPQVHLHNMAVNLQKTGLTHEEYENILNHINSYVQKLVDVKMLEQEKLKQHITPQQQEIFVKVVRENLENFAREKHAAEGNQVKLAALSDEELALLAQRVQIYLESSGWSERPIKFSNDNIAEIKKLITQQIEINNHEHYTFLIDHIDLDGLLVRLLQSPQLAKFVDSRIDVAIANGKLNMPAEGSGGYAKAKNIAMSVQQNLIDDLNNEIAFIKLALADRNAENADLQQSITRLKVNQDDLLERLQQHELAADERFSSLLAEIQEKLNTLQKQQFTLLNKQIKLSLVEILGFKQTAAGGKIDDLDLQAWVRNIFVAKDYLEERLAEMNIKTNERIKDEIDRSGMLLMRDISERLKQEILIAVEAKHNESTIKLKGEIYAALSEDEIRNIVKSVLAIYDADKTGLVDFALESAGGQILSTRCTENYQLKSAQISVFGIPLWYPTNTPRVAISPNVQPGECWAFQGFPGFLVLKLNSLVYVTGFTLEHIPRSLSPNGRIESAPRNFTVWGLEHEKDQDPILFGEYEYLDIDASLQYFPVQNQNIKRPYEIVELRIETNHGNPQYTCLYRFRVHGKPPTI